MSGNVVFVDVETTGLDPEKHDVFEVSLIEEDEAEHLWWLPLNDHAISQAEPGALRVNRWYDRVAARRFDCGSCLAEKNVAPWCHHGDEPKAVAFEIARRTTGKKLVGNVPSFDAAFLDRFLRKQGFVPAWDHVLVCVKTLFMGMTGTRPEKVTNDMITESLGVDPILPNERHTASGDNHWNRRVYEAIFKGRPGCSTTRLKS